MAMVGSLPWDSQAAWDNKVLLATNLSYRSHLLVMCVYYSLYVGCIDTGAAYMQAWRDLHAACKFNLSLQRCENSPFA